MAYQALNRGSSPGDPAAESIYSGAGKINANCSDLYGYRPHNVLDYGALGNAVYNTGGGQDDTTYIQAAYTAAAASGGRSIVVFPGHRTYRITSTITVPQGIQTLGLGGQDSSGFGIAPQLVWDGVNNGVAVSVTGSGGYAIHTLFQNIGVISGNSITNKLACGVRFASTARPESGTGFIDCWFQTINGNAIEVLGGATNFYIVGGRFDSVYGGYGLYVELPGGASFTGTISGNTNWVGGNDGQGKGFVFMNGEAAGSGESHLAITGIHTEVNQDLTETYSSGTFPSDKQGIIRLGTDATFSGLQHHLSVDGWYNGHGSGLKSYSAVQITATSGTDATASNHARFVLTNGNTCHVFVSSDSGATNEARLVGGMVPTERRYTHRSARQSFVAWGYGPDSFGDSAGGGIFQRPGTFIVSGLALQALTVAQVGSFSYSEGAIAYVTDATAVTLGSVVAGGGSNKVQIMYDGTNWRITAKVMA